MATRNRESSAQPFAQTAESFQHVTTQHCGLTKRESAAIAAMQGLLARPAEHQVESVAAHAVQCADELFDCLDGDAA